MSSPVKDTGLIDSVSNISNLKPGDSKLLVLGSLCIKDSGKVSSPEMSLEYNSSIQ